VLEIYIYINKNSYGNHKIRLNELKENKKRRTPKINVSQIKRRFYWLILPAPEIVILAVDFPINE